MKQFFQTRILAIVYCCLFSINALGTSIIASLTATDWSAISGTQRFMIISAIVVNWTGLVMAFLNKSAGEKFPQVSVQTTSTQTK